MACVSGEYHTISLSDDGEVYSFGRNNVGQLGLGHKNDVSIPTPIPNLPKIMEISCGRNFTVCVDNEGGLWSFGENNNGLLGTGNATNYNIPQKIEDIPPVRSVSCGYYHTLIITNDSNLWSCGENDFGQLCLENTEKQTKYQQTSFEQILKISAGGYNSFFQNKEEKIFGCGYNEDGQCGLGHFSQSQIKVALIPDLPLNIVEFYSGFMHSLFLDSDGNVFSVGYNEDDNLGLGHSNNQNVLHQIPNIPPIRKISCVDQSSYLLDVEGNLWNFGNNDFGQLGHGDNTDRNIPTKIASLTNIMQMVQGYGPHFLVKDSRNKIFVMGRNDYGQLGTENQESLSLPEQINSQSFPIWGECRIICKAKSARK